VEALNLNLSMQKPFDSHFHGLLERAVLLLWQESNKDSISKPKGTQTPEVRMPAPRPSSRAITRNFFSEAILE
jgi:hypothetical protein